MKSLSLGFMPDVAQLRMASKLRRMLGTRADRISLPTFAELHGGKTLPDIATWTKRHDGAPVILTPVPSRSDVSFLLCQELAKELRSSGVSASVRTDLLKRKSPSEMKDAPWERREKLAKEFYELDSPAQLSGTFLLVDDVMTSGATMRTCASLLHAAGASRVAAAALSAAPGDAPWAIASDAPHGFAFMAVNKEHQSCSHQMEGAF